MKETPQPLSPAEMQEQLRRFAETNTTSRAARSIRYDMGIPHPEGKTDEAVDRRAVPLDISQPADLLDWQCTGCGARLNAGQLKIHRSRFASGGQDMAMCPHCGGAAYSLHKESVRQADAFEQQQRERASNLRSGLICAAAGVLFLIFPTLPTYLLCWIVAFWCGPLREVHLKMKLGAVFAIMWAGLLVTFVIGSMGVSHLGSLLIWLLVTAVIVAAGWMIEKAAAFGGGLFYKG